jgi:tetratricopeptide (TPR) repeat protein
MTKSPLIYEYLKKWQEDPTSRVFAPLSEAYRKAGMYDEAVRIAREGLEHHPHFIGGKVALARSLFELQEYDQVIDCLSQVVQDVPDNIVAQKLMAESCLMRGRVQEALSGYKMLLFYAPNDLELAQMVQELEKNAYDQGALVMRRDPVPVQDSSQGFEMQKLDRAISQDPEFQRNAWIKKIEILQNILQNVERYRSKVRAGALQ